MIIKNLSLIPVLLFSLIVSVNAQDPPKPSTVWTLEGCIDYALKNNIQIKQSELNTELSQINLVQSKATLLPSLNANGSHAYNYGRTIDRFTNNFSTQQVLAQNFSISSEVTLFGGLKTINSIKENTFNWIASKYDVDKIRNDISLNIASAYLQILFSMENFDIARNQLGITNAQVERTKKLVDAGSAAKGTLLDIQAQLASEELNITTAQSQLDISYLNLVQLLNLTTAEGFGIVKPELNVGNESLLTATVTQIYNSAVSNLPEIKSAEYKVKSAEKAVDIAWGGLSPRLTFSASYGTGYSSASEQMDAPPSFLSYEPDGSITSTGVTILSPAFSDPTYKKTPYSKQLSDNTNESFGFYLTIPIFNRFQNKSAIERARVQKLNAELIVEATRLQIQKNIQQAYADAGAGLKKYNATLKTVDAMQESFKYTEQKFNVGMVNTNDYNDSKNKLIKAQSDLLQAKYEYVFKTKVLDFYQGKPLKF